MREILARLMNGKYQKAESKLDKGMYTDIENDK